MADAHAKAEELAKLTGADVGIVLDIGEIIGPGGGFIGGSFSQMAVTGLEGAGAGVGPISPGDLNLTMQLQITYELR